MGSLTVGSLTFGNVRELQYAAFFREHDRRRRAEQAGIEHVL